MATVQTQIRIDEDVKKQANILFKDLGLDMSSVVNMFLHQCIYSNGIPITLYRPEFNGDVVDAMNEVLAMEHDPNLKTYSSVEEMNKAILS